MTVVARALCSDDGQPDYGIERRELARNVAGSMRKVPRVRREMATYTPDEIGRVLRAADKDRNGHLW